MNEVPWLDSLVSAASQRLLQLPEAHPARAYLRGRGVTDEWLRTYRIGWLDQPQQIQHCTTEFWAWALRYGWERMVFPLTDPWGFAFGLQVRHLREKGFENWVDPRGRRLTPVCFGLHVALPAAYASRRMVIVEGVFDYFAVRPYTEDVLALLTSTVSQAHRKLLSRYCQQVVCLLDMDVPGRRGCVKLAGLPLPADLRQPRDPVVGRPKLPPFRVVFPPYSEHDPDDLRKAGKVIELLRLTQPSNVVTSM